MLSFSRPRCHQNLRRHESVAAARRQWRAERQARIDAHAARVAAHLARHPDERRDHRPPAPAADVRLIAFSFEDLNDDLLARLMEQQSAA